MQLSSSGASNSSQEISKCQEHLFLDMQVPRARTPNLPGAQYSWQLTRHNRTSAELLCLLTV